MGYKINGIYVGNQKVRPSGWQPGADTVAYYPLTSSTTTTDSQGNYNLSNSGNVTFGTHNSVSCAYFNGTSTSRLYNSSISYNSYPIYTVNCRFFLDYSGSRYQTIYTIGNTYATGLLGVWYNYDVNGGSIALGAYAGGYETVTQISISTNTRHNLVVVVNGSSSKQYLDGVQIATYTNSLSNTQTGLNLGCPSHNSSDTLGGGISEFILENVAWTAQEISDYYNQTKSLYIGEVNLTTDLRGETLAGLQALGRDGITNSGAYTLNSNGLKNGNSTNNRCALNYDASQLDLTGKKLTLYEEGTISDTGYYAGKVGIRCTNPAMNTYYLEAYLNGGNDAASPSGMWVLGQGKLGPWTQGSGDYTLKYEINFSTGEINVTATGAVTVTGTYTMSSSEISSVLTGLSTGYIRFYATNYQSGHQHTLKLVSIKVQ